MVFSLPLSHLRIARLRRASVLRLKMRVKGQDDSQDQEILRWCEANDSWRHFSTAEETAAGSAGVIDPVLQSYDGGSLPIGNTIFEGCGVGLHRL